MEAKDWITLSSAVLLIVGWFVNSWLNRLHEIAKKRSEYRLKMLESYFQISSELFLGLSQDYDPFKQIQDFGKDFHKVQMDFLLFGHKKEAELFSKFVKSWNLKNQTQFKEYMNELNLIIRENLRQELGLSRY